MRLVWRVRMFCFEGCHPQGRVKLISGAPSFIFLEFFGLKKRPPIKTKTQKTQDGVYFTTGE